MGCAWRASNHRGRGMGRQQEGAGTSGQGKTTVGQHRWRPPATTVLAIHTRTYCSALLSCFNHFHSHPTLLAPVASPIAVPRVLAATPDTVLTTLASACADSRHGLT